MSTGIAVQFATGSDGELYPVLSSGTGGTSNYAKNTPSALSLSASFTANYTVAPESTVDPAQMVVIAGLTNDGTPAYEQFPLGPDGRTVIVEGYAGGVAIPVSGTFSLGANQTVNLNQIAGTTTSVGNGTTDNGTLRVSLSSDSTGQVKLAAGSHVIIDSGSTTAVTSLPSIPAGSSIIGALVADQTINIDQVGGNATAVGNGTTSTGTQRVTIASDSTGKIAVTESGVWTVQPGNTPNTAPWLISPSLALNTTPVAANKSSDTVIKNSAGTYWGTITSAAGTAAALIYDNASAGSGTAIGIAGLALASVDNPSAVGRTCANGITVKGSGLNPGFTVLWI